MADKRKTVCRRPALATRQNNPANDRQNYRKNKNCQAVFLRVHRFRYRDPPYYATMQDVDRLPVPAQIHSD